MTNVRLVSLEPSDREQFILDNQEAFRYGALEEFGIRDDQLDEDGEIISRTTIEHCLDEENNEAYRIMLGNDKVGGVILKIDKVKKHNHLEILFVSPLSHGKGIGFKAWQAVEKLYSETKVWETITPYFEKRNIHFYINKCGFQAVEFFNEFHLDPNVPKEDKLNGPDEMLRFIKIMN